MKEILAIWIEQAEKNWLTHLYDYAREVYQSNFLPSHDHTHHLRVWNIAKQALTEIATSEAILTPSLVEGVLISCMFHDLGMAQSTREDHGRLGRDLCHSWFTDKGHKTPAGFDRILYAIEMHDRKEARYYADPETPDFPGILGILSLADDLEAMGTIGIYRYAEIYLLRGISPDELGKRILENANQRFSNLSASGKFPKTISKYRAQFDELRHFYTQYELQLEQLEKAAKAKGTKEIKGLEKVEEGWLGVISYIRTRSMDGKQRPEELSSLADREGKALMLREFFSRLRNELQNARK